MFIELFGFWDFALWLDLWLPGSAIEQTGVLVDFGPVHGGYFLPLVDLVVFVVLFLA